MNNTELMRPIPILIQYTQQKQQFQYNSNTNTIPTKMTNICIWNLDNWTFSYWETLESWFRIKINLLISWYWDILGFCLGKNILNCDIYIILSEINQFFDLLYMIWFGIALVLVLVFLSFENITNTNTILTVGIVFQYNTSRIVHLWYFTHFDLFSDN